MTLISLIEAIRTNPTQILGRYSFEILRPFLDGWYHRSLNENPIENVEYEIFGEFFVWLQQHYRIGANTFWPQIIALYAQDDCSALGNFFELWDKFLDDKHKGAFIFLPDPLPTGEVIYDSSKEKQDTRTVVGLLEAIKKRPAMYAGKNNLILLKAYLDGWYFRNPSKEFRMDLLNQDFHLYLQKRLKMDGRAPWDRIILYHSLDEASALNYFFELWEQFLQSHSKIVQ